MKAAPHCAPAVQETDLSGGCTPAGSGPYLVCGGIGRKLLPARRVCSRAGYSEITGRLLPSPAPSSMDAGQSHSRTLRPTLY